MTRENVIKLIKHQPVRILNELKFGTFVFGDLHNEWLRRMITSGEDATLLAHRGSYKTTCLSVAIALLMILRPHKNIIFLRKTDDDVKEIIEQVKKILETKLLRMLVHGLYSGEGKEVDLKITRANANELNTNLNAGTRGMVQLLGIGIKGSLTGKHADLVITDDICTRVDRRSASERNLVKEIYAELQNIKNRDGVYSQFLDDDSIRYCDAFIVDGSGLCIILQYSGYRRLASGRGVFDSWIYHHHRRAV